MERSPKILLLGLAVLFFVPVWSAAGTFRAWQVSFGWISLAAWVCFFVEPARKGLPAFRVRLKNLVRDPAFWASGLFLILLLMQFLNSGRIRLPDFETGGWTWTAPRHPNLPWSFTRKESLEMIHWFIPILTGFLILRHSWNALRLRALLNVICLNGFLNALLAFLHLGLGWEAMYNIQPFGKDVYGSFGYPNHGAHYFIIMLAISMGLLLRELGSESNDRHRGTLMLHSLLTPVFFLAASLSTSRAGILGPWLLLCTVGGCLTVIAFPRLHPVQRIYVGLGAMITTAFLAGSFALFAEPVHYQEVRNATVELDVAEELGARFFQVEGAYAIWKDHPWFGVGGWGYSYLAAEYMDPSEWNLLGKGKANVHNDLMQFLAEFGLVGLLLLCAVFSPTVFKGLRNLFRPPTDDNSIWADPLRIAAATGVFLLFVISLFDIPLRSPAVFMHGLLLMMLLRPHPDILSLWQPKVDWNRLQPSPLRIQK